MIAMVRIFAVLTVAVSVAACAGPEGAGKRTDKTSEMRAVPPDSDLVNLTAGEAQSALVLTIVIDDNEVTVQRTRVMRAPRSRSRQRDGTDQVLLKAYRGDTVVGTATASDPVINIQEGVGLVELSQRTVTVAVPLDAAPDTVEIVSSRNRFATERVSVAGTIAEHCRAYPRVPLCRKGTKASQ